MASPDAPSGAGTPIDVESTIVDEAPHPGAASGPAVATRPAASPLLFGSVPLTMPEGLSLTVPDSMPLTMPGVLPGAMPSPKEGETDPAVVPMGDALSSAPTPIRPGRVLISCTFPAAT